MTYNEFQSACKRAWATEGQGDNDCQTAHRCLCAVPFEEKKDITLTQLIAAAWRIYKSNVAIH